MANSTNSITVEGIDAAYGAVRVLEDVSLRVDSGETVVLLMPGSTPAVRLAMERLILPELGHLVEHAQR